MRGRGVGCWITFLNFAQGKLSMIDRRVMDEEAKRREALMFAIYTTRIKDDRHELLFGGLLGSHEQKPKNAAGVGRKE